MIKSIASIASAITIATLLSSSAHSASYGTCFELKPIEFVKVHGNNQIVFKVENDETRYKLIDGTDTSSGKSMHKMLTVSIATGTRVTGYSDDVDCKDDLVKSIVLYNS